MIVELCSLRLVERRILIFKIIVRNWVVINQRHLNVLVNLGLNKNDDAPAWLGRFKAEV